MESEYLLNISEEGSLYSGWKTAHEEAYLRLKKKCAAKDTIVGVRVNNPRYKKIHG